MPASRKAASVARKPPGGLQQVLTHAAYLTLFVVLAGRPLFYESYEPVEFSFLEQLGVEDDVTPALTVTLDFILLASAGWITVVLLHPGVRAHLLRRDSRTAGH